MRPLLLVLLATLVVLPRGAHAQCGAPPMPCIPYEPGPSHDWQREARMLGINAALGAVTAGVLHKLRGGDFTDAFLKGALGGGITYGAKRLAAQDAPGVGFFARQLGSVGDSFVRNAAEGVPLLERIYLPLWLVRLEVRPSTEEQRIQPRIDALTTGWMLYALFDDDLTFHPGRSLSSGALVYNSADEIGRGDDGRIVQGATIGGVILLGDEALRSPEGRRRTFAHERVHVLQLDQVHSYWSGPLESWGLRTIGLPGVALWVDINLLPHFAVLYSGQNWDDRPWEKEAEWMTR